jgi:SAM-dependent methyltransferase
MRHLRLWAGAPADDAAVLALSAATRRLGDKLARVRPAVLGISEYNQRYLGERLAMLDWTLEMYSYLLWLCLRGAPGPLSEVTLVDYGGGTGMLSFLAKELGVGRVIYNDIYDVSCEDVLQTGQALGVGPDDVVCGEIDDVIEFVRREGVDVDALGSFDVIEHVYDVDEFLSKMAELSRGRLRVVHASSANAENPRVARRLKRMHAQREEHDLRRREGWKERDNLKSYLTTRAEIIRAHRPELSEEQVGRLARMTRGLRRTDIERSADEYLERGDIAYRPDHPTNTCDPLTGNWAEHLLDLRHVEQVLRRAGFEVEILSGYYGASGRPPVRLAKQLVNLGIQTLGRRGMPLAPYYVVCAQRGGA